MQSIPKFHLPEIFSKAGSVLPQWPHSLALVAALNLALKCQFFPENELAALEDKIFRVSVTDTGGVANFRYTKGLFRPIFKAESSPDLSFSASLSSYVQLLSRQEDPDTLFFTRELQVTGDTELGLRIKNMLDAMDWSRLFALPGWRS